MRRLSQLLPVAGAIVLASCGGSDGDKADATKSTTSTAPGTVTRESYIAQGDAFCKRTNAEAKRLNERSQRAVGAQSSDTARLAALEPVLKVGYAVQQRNAKAFDAIPSPPADAATVAQLRAGYDHQTAFVRQLLDAAHRRDVAAVASIIAQKDRVTKRDRRVAQSYGFKECGSGNNEAG